MAVKHAEQTTMKQQETASSPGCLSKGGNIEKLELTLRGKNSCNRPWKH
jgi:hypothetical protein